MQKKLLLASLLIILCGSFIAFKANQGKKVSICHKGHEIGVSANAIPAHVAHGDRIGGCATIDPF